MSDNIQDKIEELEKQKMLDELKYKETNINYNIERLDKFIQTTNNQIKNGRYSKSYPLEKWNDQRIISYLTPIYNLLKITNERLDKIESALDN
mgnify:CR=1 FL=1